MTRRTRILYGLLSALLVLTGDGDAFAQAPLGFDYSAGQLPGPGLGIGLAAGASLEETCPTLLQIQAKLPIDLGLAGIAATATPGDTSPVMYTGAPSTSLVEGVPVCTDHDPTKWHPLVK